jgi:hypothetical protein
MKQLDFSGYREGPYAGDAVDVDFGQGRIRGRPAPGNLFSVPSGDCHAIHYHVESGYYVAVIGSTLYRLSSGSSVSLATGINPPVSLHRFGDRIVCVASNKLVLINPSNWTTSTVSRPSKPSGVSAAKTSWQQSDFSNVNAAGGATVNVDTFSIDIDDNTSDPIQGAWAELYRTDAITDFVSYAVIDVLGKDNELAGATVQAVRATSNSVPEGMGGTVSALQQGRVLVPVFGKGLLGFRVWVDRGKLWIWRAVHLLPEMRPTAYRITAVDSNDWESEPLEVQVTGSARHEDVGYYVYLTGLGTSTKRIYRQDSLGYWRLVAETSSSAFFDSVPEEELGRRLVDILPPTGGYSAVVWQGRLCVASTNELYVSAVGQFNFSTHEGGDKLKFPCQIKALVDAGTSLLVGADEGWYSVAGAPGAWVVSRLGLAAPQSQYSSSLPVVQSGRTLIFNKQVVATNRNVVSAATAGEYTAVVTDSEWLVFAGGKWSRWQLPSVPVVAVPSLGADATFSYIYNGYMYAISMPGSTRSSFILSQKFPLPERGQVRFIHVDGSGSATATINSQQFATNSSLPVTADWKRAEAWVLDVNLSVSGELYRMLVDVEAMTVRR